ncbi:MAG: cohesin domain-containing protein [Acidobacteriota bacterium]
MKIRCVLLCLASGLALRGAELSLSSVSVVPGGTATVEVRYAAQGAKIAAVQFDLRYDETSFTISAGAGPAATASGKAVGASNAGAGILRVLAAGFDQTAIRDGVVAVLRVSARAGGRGTYPLRLSGVAAADSGGNPAGVSSIDGTVTVTDTGTTSAAGVLEHVVAGGSWQTAFTLLNTSANPARARLVFRGNNGQPIQLALSPAADCTLAPGAMCEIDTAESEAGATLEGWAELQGPDGVVAFAVMRRSLGGGEQSIAMLPFGQGGGLPLVVPFDNTNGFLTGIALANGAPDTPAELTLALRDESGVSISEEPLTLPAGGHTSFVAGDKYPALRGLRGSIEVRGPADTIRVLGLRFAPDGSFTPFPVVAE